MVHDGRLARGVRLGHDERRMHGVQLAHGVHMKRDVRLEHDVRLERGVHRQQTELRLEHVQRTGGGRVLQRFFLE